MLISFRNCLSIFWWRLVLGALTQNFLVDSYWNTLTQYRSDFELTRNTNPLLLFFLSKNSSTCRSYWRPCKKYMLLRYIFWMGWMKYPLWAYMQYDTVFSNMYVPAVNYCYSQSVLYDSAVLSLWKLITISQTYNKKLDFIY